MDRFVLTDAQWAKMEPHCLGKPSDPGRSGSNNRLFVEAVLWIARTGSPWRDLPKQFGKWNSVFVRYRDWGKAGVFKRLFDAASISQTWNMPWSMPPSSRSTVTDRAQKGDAKSGDRQVQGRYDDQNPRSDRRTRQSGPLYLVARSALRNRWR